MSQIVAVVTAAYQAERWIGEAVRSVREQTHADWQHWIVADDKVDYAALLASEGLLDQRQVFLRTGKLGAGPGVARNLALDRIEAPYVAILDADDRFCDDKLERVLQVIGDHPIVTSAVAEFDVANNFIRTVGSGPDQVLSVGAYKWVNITMDSMVVWDRRRVDARYDASLPAMSDLELLLKLFARHPATFHFGRALHDYRKVPTSISNSPGMTQRMVTAKRELLQRFDAGAYLFPGAEDANGMAEFLRRSLAAEESYPAALKARPGLLFEDHLEPLLRRGSADRS